MISNKTKTYNPKIYLCPVCNKETGYYDMCDLCYRVEDGIDNYLSTKEGIRRIQQKIKEALK